jgi:mannosyltransferase
MQSGRPVVPRAARLRVPLHLPDGAARVVAIVAVLGFTAVAAILRAHALGARFWIDEGISVGIASHPLTAIPGVLRQDGSPPLYYVLLHVWMALLGHREAAVHELSYACAVLAVPAGWWAATAAFGRWAAACCAAFLALSPFVGLYADEARMYTLVLLLAVLTTGAFLRAYVLRRRGHLITFALLMAALLYTHAWAAFLALSLALGALLLVAAGPDRRSLAIDVVLGFGAAALLYVPWLPTLAYQTAHTGAPWSHRPGTRSLTSAMWRMLNGRTPERIVLLAAVAGGVLGLVRGDGIRRRATLVAVLAAAGTLLVAFAWSRTATPAWALRYLVMVLAPLAVAVGCGLGRLGLLGLATPLVVFALFWHGKPTDRTLHNKSDVQHVASRLGADLPRGSIVFSTQPEEVPVLAYYLPGGLRYWTPLGPVADPGVMDWRDAMPRLRAARFGHVVPAMLRAVPPGGRVLLVRPEFSHPDAPWTRRIRQITRSWGSLLRHRMTTVASVVPAHGSSRSTVTGVVLERAAAASPTRRHPRRTGAAASSARGGPRRPAAR